MSASIPDLRRDLSRIATRSGVGARIFENPPVASMAALSAVFIVAEVLFLMTSALCFSVMSGMRSMMSAYRCG